jgi:hypothetical protein
MFTLLRMLTAARLTLSETFRTHVSRVPRLAGYGALDSVAHLASTFNPSNGAQSSAMSLRADRAQPNLHELPSYPFLVRACSGFANLVLMHVAGSDVRFNPLVPAVIILSPNGHRRRADGPLLLLHWPVLAPHRQAHVSFGTLFSMLYVLSCTGALAVPRSSPKHDTDFTPPVQTSSHHLAQQHGYKINGRAPIGADYRAVQPLTARGPARTWLRFSPR